jgi:hypothetical protein
MRQIPDQVAAKWSEGIHSLVNAVLDGTLENYMIVTTSENRSFRLFVSRIMNYYSGETEIHIYIILMVSTTFGNQITARLAKAIDVGLKFRSLMLEKESKFQPDDLEFPTIDIKRLKPLILQMLSQLDLILRDSRSANLDDPKLLRLIWGTDAVTDIQIMMKDWGECFQNLSNTAHKVLETNEESFLPAKREFIDSLRRFDDTTADMNRRYTAGVLTALEHIVRDNN